ncbi:MAG TPA: glycosyltransferase family 2 protein, partial [Arthrobacter sp.]|nr:glycosyltransferase family 2 protein [Arthrobacter sp.]
MSLTISSEALKSGEDSQTWRTLQRVILPSQSQMDTVPLYIDTGNATGKQLPTSNIEAGGKVNTPSGGTPSKEVHVEDFLTRHSTSVRP